MSHFVSARRRWISLLTIAAVTISGAAAVDLDRAAAAPVAAAPVAEPAQSQDPVTSRPDVVSARIAAEAQGTPVEVTSLEDEYSSTYANPDGTLTTDTSQAPLRVMQNGQWADVDYTLQHVEGGWSPKASPVAVTFSDGGDKNAVSLGDGSKQVDQSWGVTLPAPTIDGPTATYVLGDGESLVLTAYPTGFEQSLVLDHAPTTLPQLKLPFDTSDLTMLENTAGGYDFTNTAGDVVYTMPAPMMYGGPTDSLTLLPEQTHPVSASLVQTADGARLDLTPAMSWLTDPNTEYPVRIDPTIATVTGGTDAYVQDNVSTGTGSDPTIRAGWVNGHAARSYLKFTGVSAVAGKDIESASLKLYDYYANDCTVATMYAYPLSSAVNMSTVTWASKPTYNTSSAYLSGRAFAYSTAQPSCPAASTTIDLTNMVAAWAAGTIPNDGVQLSSIESTGHQGWAFCSMNPANPGTACDYTSRVPVLSITYNSIPGTPSGLSVAPCTSVCSGNRLTDTTTPKLTAKASDADGGNLQYNYVIYEGSGTPSGAGMLYDHVSNVPSGATATYTVPAGHLLNGHTYQYHVLAYDGTDVGAYSAYAMFTVDTTAPATPTISSTTWTAGQWSSPTSGTISWSDSASDLATYSYQIDGGSWSAPTTSTSKALTLSADSPHSVAVKATDTAGNVSPTATLSFGIGTGGLTSPAQGDTTQASVTIASQGPSSTKYVTYQYRVGTTGSWSNVPVGDVTLPGTNTHPTTWPVVSTDSTVNGTATYAWNLANSVNPTTDGDVQVQACLSASSSGSSPVCQATPTDVQLSVHSFDAANATTDIGPGTLSDLTGDYSVSASDGGGVSRTSTTLDPAAASTSADGVFGPSWTSSLTGPNGSNAGQTPIVAPTRSYVTFTDADGGQSVYTATGSLTGDTVSYNGIGDAATDGTVVKYAWNNPTNPSVPHITMTDQGGTVTTWTKPSGSAIWIPYSVVATGTAASNTSSYYYNSAGLPVQIVSPSAVDCSTQTLANITEGCRSFTFSYATVTVGGSNVTRLSKINLVAWDPATSAMVTTAIAQYDYDGTGRLQDAWDPRISPALKTAYTYTSSGQLSTLTPPGLAAWTLHYDGSGRLSTITRPDPSGPTATTTIVYGLPLSGTGLPDVTAATTATWGETGDLPTTGTAIFNPDHIPAGTTPSTVTSSDWPYASISYLDVNGRDINDAAYGAGDWQISTAQYDATGNDVWDLTDGNRSQALIPTDETDPYAASLSDTAERANLLATVDTYNVDGTDPIDEQGPIHPVTLADGTVIDARTNTVTAYDAGAPNSDVNPATGEAYALPTSTTTSALDPTGVNHDAQTATTGYAAIVSGDPDGWATGRPTTQTDAGGLATKVRYDATGRMIEQRLPGDPSGTGPRTTLTSYYTATGTGSCVNAAFAGMPCSTTPAAQPSTGNPLPVTTFGYDMYGNVTTKTETYGSGTATVRTTTTAYDSAGRESSSSISVTPSAAGGTTLPTVNYGYSTSTGLPTTTSTTTTGVTTTLTTGYDSLGQANSYTDATGNVTSTSYDLDGRVVSVGDGKGTTSYTYDNATEHRGLVTGEDIGVVGASSTFSATYDAAANMNSETYPNGLIATSGYDNNDNRILLTYASGGTTLLAFDQAFDSQGRVATLDSPESSQVFGHDASGRLTSVEDTISDPVSGNTLCTTRVYAFNDDTDRTSLTRYPDAGTDPANGSCSSSTTPTTVASTFDQADRITNTGYSYDSLGRTTVVPAADAQGIGSHAGTTGNLTVGYDSNDMVATESQGSSTLTFTLDPLQDRINTSSDGTTTTTNHFSDTGDSPAWTSTNSSAWTRDLTGLDGNLAATADQSGTVTLQLSNLQAATVATVADTSGATLASYSESTEYGAPRNAATAYDTNGWLGSNQRSSNDLGGLIIMGVRLYNPATGRFLSVDSMFGGNANTYTYPTDPLTSYDPTGQHHMFFGDVYFHSWGLSIYFSHAWTKGITQGGIWGLGAALGALFQETFPALSLWWLVGIIGAATAITSEVVSDKVSDGQNLHMRFSVFSGTSWNMYKGAYWRWRHHR